MDLILLAVILIVGLVVAVRAFRRMGEDEEETPNIIYLEK